MAPRKRALTGLEMAELEETGQKRTRRRLEQGAIERNEVDAALEEAEAEMIMAQQQQVAEYSQLQADRADEHWHSTFAGEKSGFIVNISYIASSLASEALLDQSAKVSTKAGMVAWAWWHGIPLPSYLADSDVEC